MQCNHKVLIREREESQSLRRCRDGSRSQKGREGAMLLRKGPQTNECEWLLN